MSSHTNKIEQAEILLDTNALLWYLNGDERMSQKSADKIYKGIANESISVSIASFWEILCFSEKKMSLFNKNFSRQLLISKIKEVFRPKTIPIDEKIMFKAYDLPQFHSDPADRFLVSTAILNKYSLCTSDELIIKWHKNNATEFVLVNTKNS
jgi:PIN domain nuclease of toxin-antitoxin system